MAQKKVVTLICDLCGSERDNEVATHRVQIDREHVELEACERCWSKFTKAASKVMESGRRKRAAALKAV